MHHYAVISTDDEPIYAFCALVTTIFFREILGWRTIILVLPGLHEVFTDAYQSAGAQVTHTRGVFDIMI